MGNHHPPPPPRQEKPIHFKRIKFLILVVRFSEKRMRIERVWSVLSFFQIFKYFFLVVYF